MLGGESRSFSKKWAWIVGATALALTTGFLAGSFWSTPEGAGPQAWLARALALARRAPVGGNAPSLRRQGEDSASVEPPEGEPSQQAETDPGTGGPEQGTPRRFG